MANFDGWLDSYFDLYRNLAFERSVYPQLEAFHDLCLQVRESHNKLMFAGNGASASISSHGAVDFTKQGRVRAVDFNEPNLITCFSNDFGYENWIARAIERYGDRGDVAVMISVSGTSKNVVNAANYAKANGMKVVTFSGKAADNPLRAIGDINFWVPSDAYNVVEGIHMMWITTVVDMLVGKAAYSVV
jgi:D-sedoheptulose 7-phosphate isomerase